MGEGQAQAPLQDVGPQRAEERMGSTSNKRGQLVGAGAVESQEQAE